VSEFHAQAAAVSADARRATSGRGMQAQAFALLFAATVALQWIGNAYRAEPLVQGDEAAHVVTGLMVRDYVASGLGQNPMRFAENYYLHYPQVALGHWPPVFFAVEAAWMLVLPPSRVTIFLFLALLATMLCFRVFQVVSRSAPAGAALGCALLLDLLAPVQLHARLVLAELLLAWLCLEAMLASARWLTRPGAKTALAFAVWSSGAILTKATGAALGFLPLAAICIARRFRLFAKPSLWVAGLIVIALCAPWYLYAPGARHEASMPLGGLIGVDTVDTSGAQRPAAQMGVPQADELMERARVSLVGIPILFGWMGPALLIALAGAWKQARAGDVLAAASLGLLAAFFLFRFVMEAAAMEERLLLPVVAPLFLFLWRGCEMLGGWLPPRNALAITIAVVGLWSCVAIKRMQPAGIQEVAADLASRPEYRDAAFLVSSDANSEAVFVEEVALREKVRPLHYVLRSSKVLASSAWNGDYYRPIATDAAEVIRLLESVPVGLVILDPHPRPRSIHNMLLEDTVQAHPELFRRVAAAGTRFRVYEMAGYRNRPRGTVSIFLYGLGRTLKR
jgi:hypothetical protein